MNDVSLDAICDVFGILDPYPRIVSELDQWRSQYKSQKAHVLIWFANQDTTGCGAYSRQNENTSVRTTYNRLLNPGMLIWIAAVLGVDAQIIRKATEAAIEAEKQNYRKRCSAFREVIPFDIILEMLKHPKKWKQDRKMQGIYTIGADNLPHMVEGQQDRYDSILERELW